VVDLNGVATEVGSLVEVQGTAEGATFARSTLDAMMDSALVGIATLTGLQRAALADPLRTPVG
jgi:ribonuclease PH